MKSTPVSGGAVVSHVMLIGQAPGWREIETGLPFAHDAGRRLVGWLALASLAAPRFDTVALGRYRRPNPVSGAIGHRGSWATPRCPIPDG